MSERLSGPARFNPSPVSQNSRRGDRIPQRVRSLGSLRGSELSAFMRSHNRVGRSVGRLSGSKSSGSSLNLSKMEGMVRDYDEMHNYENFFIGSSKQPRIQNKIYTDEEINLVQETESKNKKSKELVDIIQEALGTKKKPRQLKPRVEERQIPAVLYNRTNSTPPKEIWKISDINNYRTKK